MEDATKTPNWGERFVTWQALGIIISVLVVGIGWALLSAQQVNAKLEKHTEAQQQLNDTVIRLDQNMVNVQKTLDKIAAKLNVQ